MADRKNIEVGYVRARTVEDEADELDLEYHDDPAEGDNPPSYEEVQSLEDGVGGEEEEKKKFIYNAVVATLTVLVCVGIVCGVGGYFLALTPDGPQRPRKQESTSRNGALNFVEKYPALNVQRSSGECRAAWGELTAIPCHEAIWMRNWDDGISGFLGPSLDQYVPLICEPKCTDALRDAQAKIGAVCAGQDAFITNEYTGTFNTDLLESDPAKVLDVLVARTTKMCRKSPVDDAERGFCMTDLNSRWNIIDGINSNGLPGLEWFLSATKSPRRENAGMHTGRQGSGGWSERYSYWREERRFGPGRNETTCSWCTFQWFEEKLGLWEEKGSVLDGEAMSLPAFLRMWESAGKRCEGDRFYEVYDAVVQGYKDKGLLEESWDQLPSGDTQYLLRHGPSDGDFPITWAKEALKDVEKHRVLWADPELSNPALVGQLPLLEEYASCIETFITSAKDLPCYPFLMKEDLASYLLASPSTAKELCNPACQISMDGMRRKLWDSCPKARSGHWEAYTSNSFLDFPLLKYLGSNRNGFQGTMPLYETACRVEGHDSVPCAAILKGLGAEKWTFRTYKPSAKELIKLTRKELSLLAEMPQQLKDYTAPVDRHATKEENETWRLLSAWREKLNEGVCSECVWRRFVPKINSFFLSNGNWLLLDRLERKEVAIEWIKTVHLMRDECVAHGAREFQDNEVKKVDEAWIGAFSKDSFDEALREGREEAVWLRKVNMLPILPPIEAASEEQEIREELM